MLITVAICTWNRAELLDATLQRMRELSIPPEADWQLLVVNNRCTDHTDEIIQRYQNQLPIRRLYEPQSGLSHARNCAVKAATGDLILWTDDDVLVGRHWLAKYVQAAIEHSDAAFFGAPILPWFETTPPAWIETNLDYLGGVYALLAGSDEPGVLTNNTLPYGANYAIRSEVQRKYLYDPNLGRMQNQLFAGEESALLNAMLNDGYQGRWIPDAKVEHFVPQERLTKQYIRDWFYANGISTVKMKLADSTSSEDELNSLQLWKKKIQAQIKSVLRRCFLPKQRWVKDYTRVLYYSGMLNEIRRQQTGSTDNAVNNTNKQNKAA